MSTSRLPSTSLPSSTPPSPPLPLPTTPLLTRPSTRVRSNLSTRLHTDLLPLGRLLSVALVLVELLIESLVLLADSPSAVCDRPLRLWLRVLMALQTAVVVLNLLNFRVGAARVVDALGPHRLGLSASDAELYVGAQESSLLAPTPNPPASAPALAQTVSGNAALFRASLPSAQSSQSEDRGGYPRAAVGQLDGVGRAEGSGSGVGASVDNRTLRGAGVAGNGAACAPAPVGVAAGAADAGAPAFDAGFSSSESLSSSTRSIPSSPSVSVGDSTQQQRYPLGLRSETLERHIRSLNTVFLVWMVVGCVWISDARSCATTSPALYRLTLVLTFIYFALLFLPLTCFCLIVCCLPLFIVVYRFLLPFSDVERRPGRAASSALIASLPCAPYVPGRDPRVGSDRAESPDEDASCVICLSNYVAGERITTLPCSHHYHTSCVEEWLKLDKRCCCCNQAVDQPFGDGVGASSVEDGVEDGVDTSV